MNFNRHSTPQLAPRKCQTCRKSFVPKRVHQMFHSKQCRRIADNKRREVNRIKRRNKAIPDSPLYQGRDTKCPCGGIVEPQLVRERLVDYCTRCQREIPVEVLRPVNFIRYDQRTALDAEIAQHVGRAKAPVDPVVSERNRRGKKGSVFGVIGYELARKLEVA